ncbi:hypothetical protein PISMIDRAFT_12444 [Pisolithus microcarpus 441]|uniref:Uncharacterized protein n=1 Tax=Pisolithus microcarpus 441 TaxID=765257 RepID=A0A0C9ZFD4_9AGAM|nr:hypothetical protein BKA83DRAFT_12444 [Pisolithus microcarpus]KIK21177.1 hypothetical protein PISMIDRAFT_12444 [Pisolithus microcarpus 441]
MTFSSPNCNQLKEALQSGGASEFDINSVFHQKIIQVDFYVIPTHCLDNLVDNKAAFDIGDADLFPGNVWLNLSANALIGDLWHWVIVIPVPHSGPPPFPQATPMTLDPLPGTPDQLPPLPNNGCHAYHMADASACLPVVGIGQHSSALVGIGRSYHVTTTNVTRHHALVR